jgi:hypothetical protein
MKLKKLALFVLLVQISAVCCPIFSVFAYELPYQQPQYKPYEPNTKPYIPKGVELEEKKAEEKKEEGLSEYVSWGNFGILTQTAWNAIFDVVPAAYGPEYVKKNKLLKEFKTNKRGDIRVKGSKKIPYWLTRWRSLIKQDNTLFYGKIDVGKMFYGLLEKYDQRLRSYGFVDLEYGKRYTPTEFKQTQYSKDLKGFYKGMPILEVAKKMVQQGTNAFGEALLVTKQATKNVEWWKLTGRVGLGFSALITSLDYGMDGSKEKCADGSEYYGCFGSIEYIAALPIDFAIGASVALLSAPIGVFVTAYIGTFLASTVLAASVGIVASLALAFTIGLAIENLSYFKRRKDIVHGKLTDLVISADKKLSSMWKSTSNWVTNIFK